MAVENSAMFRTDLAISVRHAHCRFRRYGLRNDAARRQSLCRRRRLCYAQLSCWISAHRL